MRINLQILFILFISLILPFSSLAQDKNVGVGTSTPHPSAIVHLGDDQAKGFKIPYTDTNAVIAYANSYNPPIPIANGLLIFQKGAETFFYYNAPLNKWIPLSGITGITGPKGPTGVTGKTGHRGYGSQFRHGNGPPGSPLPGDTCGSYYLDLDAAIVYKISCPGGWVYLAGPFKNKIVGGETAIVSSTFTDGPETPTTSMKPINGLNYTVVAPPGYTAYAMITAYGTVRKRQVNDEYNYAKFDLYLGTPSVAANKWQVVSMGPTGSAPDNQQELVGWSISMAADLGSGKRIEVYGAQKIGVKTGLGSITLAGNPGSPEIAHLEVMVVYVKL